MLTASYEARPFGVRSAMPLYRARELCPELVVRAARISSAIAQRRSACSRSSRDGARAVEGLSLDEAFVDAADATLEEAVAFARARARARARRSGLTVSAGVAAQKMLAKIASRRRQARRTAVVAPGTEAAYLAPLPVGRLWGIGPKTQPRLRSGGHATIGDIAALDDAACYTRFSAAAARSTAILRAASTGARSNRARTQVDLERGDVRVRRARRSARSSSCCASRPPSCARLARSAAMRAQTVGVKIKRATSHDHRQTNHARGPTNDADTILAAAEWCWRGPGLRGVPIRLLGTRVAGLSRSRARDAAVLTARSLRARRPPRHRRQIAENGIGQR